MLIEAIRSLLYGGGGGNRNLTTGATDSLRVVQAHAPYAQASLESRIYYLDSGSVTLAAANVTATAMATAKLINGFYNPANSGRNALIVAAHVATVSGTPGGPFFWNYTPLGTAPTNTGTGTIRSAVLGGAAGSWMTPEVNVVLTTNPASTVALTQLGVMGGPAAIATGAGMYDAWDEPAGRIVVPPGVLVGIMALAAGTTHIVQSTIIWEEVPVNS